MRNKGVQRGVCRRGAKEVEPTWTERSSVEKKKGKKSNKMKRKEKKKKKRS